MAFAFPRRSGTTRRTPSCALRESPHALRVGDVLIIPDKTVPLVRAETEKRHIVELLRRARPAYDSRLHQPAERRPAAIAPVFAQTPGHKLDVSFLPQIVGALRHVATTSTELRYHALIAGRQSSADKLTGASCARLLEGDQGLLAGGPRDPARAA